MRTWLHRVAVNAALGRLRSEKRFAARIAFGDHTEAETTRDNPSPYDGTIFARHIGNAPLAAFALLVEPAELARALLPEPGGPAQHGHAYDALHQLAVDLALAAQEHGSERR